jgi:2-polyprenyl-6-methoxyphenol hydroxylase-like FAD-dependent oxidoreductase
MRRASTADPQRADVLVVGGGPVGLLLADLLLAAGIGTRVVEQAPTLPTDLRASSFHPATLDLLAEVGLSDPLIAQGLHCPHWQVRLHPSGERAVFPLSVIAGETRHPFRLQCEQRHLSAALERRIQARLPGALTLETICEDVWQDAEGVVARLAGPDGPQEIRCRYLVGADGARSGVRAALGIPFEGVSHPETTLVVTTPFPFEEHFEGMSLVTSCWTPGGNAAFLRLPGFWRLALTVPDGASAEAMTAPAALEANLQALLPSPQPFPVKGAWPYRVQERLATRFVVGRILLAGDAAHVNSPAGGLGLNAGLHDAFELAAALRAVLREGAGEERLDLYGRRRRKVVADAVIAQSASNRLRMRERDPDRRRAMLAELQAIVADPGRLYSYVMRASMIEGLRAAAAMT